MINLAAGDKIPYTIGPRTGQTRLGHWLADYTLLQDSAHWQTHRRMLKGKETGNKPSSSQDQSFSYLP